jgi:hypothetical protein
MNIFSNFRLLYHNSKDLTFNNDSDPGPTIRKKSKNAQKGQDGKKAKAKIARKARKAKMARKAR